MATGEQVTIGLLAAGDPGRGRTGDQLPRRSVPDRDRQRLRPGADQAHRRGAAPRRAPAVATWRWWPVSRASTSRATSPRSGAAGSDTTAVALAAALQRRALRDLHRRRRRLHHRSRTLPGGAQARPGQLRGDAGDGLARGQGAADPIGGVRDEVPGAPVGEVVLQRRSRDTLVCEEDVAMEDVLVSGIAYDRNEAKLVLRGVPDRPGVAAQHLRGARSSGRSWWTSSSRRPQQDGRSDLSFTVTRSDFAGGPRGDGAAGRASSACARWRATTRSSKISIVGVGMRNHSGVAARMFEVLGQEGINIQMISTSEIKVSCVVARQVHRARGAGAAHRVRARPARRARRAERRPSGWADRGAGGSASSGRSASVPGPGRWPPTTATLDCPSSTVRWVGYGALGHARCGVGRPPPPAVAGALWVSASP